MKIALYTQDGTFIDIGTPAEMSRVRFNLNQTVQAVKVFDVAQRVKLIGGTKVAVVVGLQTPRSDASAEQLDTCYLDPVYKVVRRGKHHLVKGSDLTPA